ncbi:MAG: molybdate ABC transporter substrate-binding protein [Terriglobia bacterium]
MIGISRLALAIFVFSLPLWSRPQETGQKASTPGQREILVAAASDLKFALDEIALQFQKAHADIMVKVTYGSSGNFYSQLSNQAPFDIFFSADIVYPHQLSGQGLALPGSDFLYAIGSLVIWVPKDSPIPIEQLKMESVRDERVHHLAIANPKHAPYGKAAEAALRSVGLYDAVVPKLVLGENVSQAFQFVQSGSAEMGFVALSLALSPGVSGQGRFWKVPSEAYPRLEQGGVILKWARDPAAAQRFRDFVIGPEGRSLLRRYGFILPGEE